MDWNDGHRGQVRRYRPRVGRRRPSVWRTTVWPVTRAIVVVGLVVALLVPGTNKVLKPFRLSSVEHRQTEKLRKELTRLKRENAILERKIRYLRTEEGWIQAARQYGLVKPGEITLVMGERDIAMANRENLPAESEPETNQQ